MKQGMNGSHGVKNATDVLLRANPTFRADYGEKFQPYRFIAEHSTTDDGKKS